MFCDIIKHLGRQLVPWLCGIFLLLVGTSYITTHASNKSLSGYSKLMHESRRYHLDPQVLRRALHAYEWGRADGDLSNTHDTLAIVDFSKPSYEKRLWIIHPQKQEIVTSLYTTQGSGSGRVYARHFSNNAGTHASSLGLYRVGNEYQGKHGLSRRLFGLEHGINDNAYKRSIVIHAANYAREANIKRQHRAGNSWGCFAVSPSKIQYVLRSLQAGSALFAYASPEKHDRITF